MTRRVRLLDVTVAIILPAFALLTWWQVDRALSGNTLSWAYVFEWPVFGGYAVYMWRRLRRDLRDGDEAGESGAPPPPEMTAREDEELRAYNEYLAALNAADRGKGR